MKPREVVAYTALSLSVLTGCGETKPTSSEQTACPVSTDTATATCADQPHAQTTSEALEGIALSLALGVTVIAGAFLLIPTPPRGY